MCSFSTPLQVTADHSTLKHLQRGDNPLQIHLKFISGQSFIAQYCLTVYHSTLRGEVSVHQVYIGLLHSHVVHTIIRLFARKLQTLEILSILKMYRLCRFSLIRTVSLIRLMSELEDAGLMLRVGGELSN